MTGLNYRIILIYTILVNIHKGSALADADLKNHAISEPSLVLAVIASGSGHLIP